MDQRVLGVKPWSTSDTEEDTVILATISHLQACVEQDGRGGGAGRAPNIFRDHTDGHNRIMADYFDPECTYPPHLFRDRYRMQRRLFLKILGDMEAHDPYFQQRPDAVGNPCLSGLQKCTAAISQLADGTSAACTDEYVRIGNSTATEALKKFCTNVVELYEPTFLKPLHDPVDILRISEENARRGFPGMLGSLDCMHWGWKNCPTSWQGQFTGKEKSPTIVLEAICTQDQRFWHAFFGMPGSQNDITVLEHSSLFKDVESAPSVEFEVNGNHYKNGYFLADGMTDFVASLYEAALAKLQAFIPRWQR